jgi:hypothetical protein
VAGIGVLVVIIGLTLLRWRIEIDKGHEPRDEAINMLLMKYSLKKNDAR